MIARFASLLAKVVVLGTVGVVCSWVITFAMMVIGKVAFDVNWSTKQDDILLLFKLNVLLIMLAIIVWPSKRRPS